MDQILLGKLHQEVSIQFDVELEVALRTLCLLNVQVKRGVEMGNCPNFVGFDSPLNDCLKVAKLRVFLLVCQIFLDKLELLDGIIVHFLLDPTEDHSVEGQVVISVELRRF